MDLRLTDTVVLVTGASRGLGAAMALALAAEGAYVVAAARSKDSLAEVAAQGGGRISAVEVDLRDEDSVRALVPEVLARHGRIDGLVNNAGIAPAGKFATQDPEIWKDALTVNVIAPMLLAQAAGVRMIEQGGGRIVNVASTTGLRGKPFLVPYSTSKGAVVRFTEALAAEWAGKNVQVNCIAPGAFVTDAQKAVTDSPELHAKRIAKIPAGRMADPSELVPLTCLLVSPVSAFTTGATFVVDGGESGKL
ncbi:glucose 1-dehydrogenase [Pimelobacter simplex]|uniref:3-oxoacyl-[acyl-carrier protein] reductase n=1 Tax=Nocardioides simplex TaxID=2045 RepID=A0A0A1DTR9_NOCSI|nr:SDR family oxidoreductase [Pimelobacter simplex]AIY18810.1 3-oxoacyl-[acyl-carrier protein] reductase [Pimelobacter simplex]MCG8152402.1 glucose 1-dehydrogenase [Pimelobacter simplex]GEB14516.1 gluconate 5-dehydrogenase [Pimelobacter simplex]SFM28770.1 2-deoxy-D-gluconate 3-dehydrogenase [Pimelobacter simplex]